VTKKRILDAALKLFNAFGLDSVRLQQIAQEAGISVGNLAYHYNTKETLLEAVQEQIIEDFQGIFSQYLRAGTLADFDHQIGLFYHFFRQNQFYLATFFKSEPEAGGALTPWQVCTTKMLLQLRSRLDFHVARRDLRPEPARAAYDHAVETIWMTLVFYPAHCTMRNLPCDERRYRRAVWNLLTPLFTAQGQAEFEEVVQPLLTIER
jgi:AcrR family transcriptional regulator